VQPGRGRLVFCGTAWGWHRTHLEDFADFGRTGKHREHDAFADMEAADLRSGLETAVAARGIPAIEEVFVSRLFGILRTIML
jgi:hypothetical protein